MDVLNDVSAPSVTNNNNSTSGMDYDPNVAWPACKNISQEKLPRDRPPDHTGRDVDNQRDGDTPALLTNILDGEVGLVTSPVHPRAAKLPSLKGDTLSSDAVSTTGGLPSLAALGVKALVGSPDFEASGAAAEGSFASKSKRRLAERLSSKQPSDIVESKAGAGSDGHDTTGTEAFRSIGRGAIALQKFTNYRRCSAALHTDLLRAFVPDILINYLEDASRPLESQAFFVTAACMCADISGFTALSEKHCKNGTAGLDTLVQIINSYYSNLVNIVYSFGGDIIKIAGDALYCVFMPDENDLRGAVLCAAMCSTMLRDVTADGLTLHVGISCGVLCFGILGGIEDYWECLMSGDPISLVARALDEAEKQQVVVSAECLRVAGDCCRGTRLPSNNLLLSSVEPPRKEKRGSVRVANMIANKGLPVELEPVKGLELFGGMAGGTGGMSEGVTTLSSPAGDRISPIAAAAAAATLYRGDNDGGTASQMADTSEVVAGVTATRGGGGGLPARKEERRVKKNGKGVPCEISLGAAVMMRAEASARVLPLLEGFVPGPVSDMLAAGIFMYMAEMRTVTTLFVKLDSYCPEKHKNLLSLQIHLTTVQKILAEHEGFLRQFLVDDKGCVLIACWGVPGRSYPDNGNRCLAAAVEMHASLLVKEMKTSMGVTSGPALCGRVGGKIRSEYAMVGDVINLAARLMGKAKGRIICDEVTHDLVCTVGNTEALFKRLDPMMLKGKAHPIAPFVCLAQQGTDMWETHKQTRMIGRTQLQNAVNAFLDALGKDIQGKTPEPHVVVIEGTHGTGKTMVADRVKKSASQFFRRKVYMYSMAQSFSNVPYSGAKGMLRTIFGLDHLGDDAIAIRDTLLKAVREVYGSAEDTTTGVAIAALKVVIGVDAGGETEGEIMNTRRASMKGRLPLHAIHSVISELATKVLRTEPAVFILDNVHLMDEMSWKLLIQLLKCPLRLLIVLTATPVEEDIRKRKQLTRAKKENNSQSAATGQTSRPEGADGLNLVWHGEHGETHLHMQQYIRATQLPITTKFSLPPFTKEELRQLLQHTLVPKDKIGITEDLVDTVYGLSGGNPYWCVEVVRFIKERSVGIFMTKISQATGTANIEKGSGGSGAAGGGAASPEEAMMGRMAILVVCRFERLLVEEQSVIRYASVAGAEFSMSVLHFVLPRNIRPQLELIVQALVTARFIVHSRHSYYKFRNSMVHLVLYNLTPATGRKRMHKAVADYYMAHHRNDPLYLPVMTYHLLQAEVYFPQAVEFLCKTAAHALVSFCYEDCAEALENAVELVSSAPEIHEVMVIHHHISAMHERGHTAQAASRARLLSGRSVLEVTAGSKSELSGRNALGSVGSEDNEELQPESLDDRIEKLRERTLEAHGRLCTVGAWCPTLKGQFSPAERHSPQAGGDSPNTHPERPSSEDPERWLERQRSDTGLDLDMARRTCVPRGFPGESISSLSTAGLSSGRASAELKGWELGDETSVPERDQMLGLSSMVDFAVLRWTTVPLRVREGRVDAAGGSGAAVLPLGTLVPLGKAHRSSLKWGVAHMLDARLAHYLLPGATAPECPDSSEVNFSTSRHRLPSEAGGEGTHEVRETSDDEEEAMGRCVETGSENDVTNSRRGQLTAFRTKVLSYSSSRALNIHGGNLKAKTAVASVRKRSQGLNRGIGAFFAKAGVMASRSGFPSAASSQTSPSSRTGGRRAGGRFRLEITSGRSAPDQESRCGISAALKLGENRSAPATPTVRAEGGSLRKQELLSGGSSRDMELSRSSRDKGLSRSSRDKGLSRACTLS